MSACIPTAELSTNKPDLTGVPVSSHSKSETDGKRISTQQDSRGDSNQTIREVKNNAVVVGPIDNVGRDVYIGDRPKWAGKPLQAPSLPPHFVDRPQPLLDLKKLLLDTQQTTPGTLVVSAIYGLGGIGKSALATALAHDRDIQERFADGILWATLGQQPDILSFLSTWIHALGDCDYKPTTKEAASTHLRTLLYDKHILLVVDDAWKSEDIEPFQVGGPDCHVLVTTREAPVRGATRYDLDMMSPQEALELFNKCRPGIGLSQTEQEQEQALALVKELKYLPLAIEQVAAQVAGRNNTHSLKVRQNCIDKVKAAFRLQRTEYKNLTELTEALGLNSSTVDSYFKGEPIDLMNFIEISVKLNLPWQEVADSEDPRNGSDHSQGFKLPEKLPALHFWVEGSRSQELQDLKAWLLNPETKTMTITAKSIVGLAGIGKTTLANQLVRQLHEENAPFAVAAWESLRTTRTDKARPFGDIIDSLLTTLSNGQIRPEDIAEYDSFKKTERLLELLKDKPCLVVLDNIESALITGNAAKTGYFASDYEEYAELFKQLVEAEHQSKVIFTSRESLAALTSGASQTMQLSGLELEHAITLLRHQNFKLMATEDELEDELEKLARRYQGHPKALELVAAVIRDDREFQGRVGRFLQDRDWLLIRHLDNIIDEVINRLSRKEKDCLTRISVYQTSEHSLVASAIAAQLPEESRSSLTENIINPLKCRQLLDYDIERDSYQLHPLIQEKAYKLLCEDSEAACTAHRRAASFYLKLAGKIEHPEETKLAFEAFEQFDKAKDIEQCYQTLLFKILGAETLEELRASEKIFNYTTKIIDFGERLIEQLTEDKKVLILIPLGIAYSEVGKNYQALKVSQIMMEYADKNDGSTQGKTLITFLKVTSRLIAGKAYRLIGNLTQALKYCEEATHISHQSKYPQGKAFALYELANVYLEIGKPEKALRGYVIAAFYATGNSITSELYQLSNTLFQPIETLTPRIQQILEKYGSKKKPGNNFKKWRILLSCGECFNKMKIYSLARFCINKSIQFVVPTGQDPLSWPYDKNPLSWSYSELALCEASMGEQKEAIDHYDHALKISKELGSLVRAKVLEKVGDWHYQQERYEESLKKYQELDELLKPTEYKLLQAKACYRLSLIYQKPEYRNLHLASEYCNHALIIAEELGVPLAEKCRELQRQLLR